MTSNPTSNLVTRLRAKAAKGGIIPIHDVTLEEAANELERQRAALIQIRHLCADAHEAACKALSGDSSAPETSARPDQTAWLIEGAHEPNAPIRYRTADQTGFHWTTDVNKAIRFVRREDAEMVAAGDEDAWHIVEHMWCDPPAQETEPQPQCLCDNYTQLICPLHGTPDRSRAEKASALPFCSCEGSECHGIDEATRWGHRCRADACKYSNQ